MSDVTDTIKRIWGDLEVVDATDILRLSVMTNDIVTGQRKVPGCCGMANAAKRSFGSTKVLFYRSVAYIEMADEDGNRRVERYTLSTGAKNFIAAFDKGEEVTTGTYTFTPPRPSERLFSTSKKARNKINREKREAAILAGTHVPSRYKPKQKTAPVEADSVLVRNGKGKVSFQKTAAVGVASE